MRHIRRSGAILWVGYLLGAGRLEAADFSRQAYREITGFEERWEVIELHTAQPSPAQIIEAEAVFRCRDFDYFSWITFQGSLGGPLFDKIAGWKATLPFGFVDPDHGDSESGLGDIQLEGYGVFPILPGKEKFSLKGGLILLLPTGDEDLYGKDNDLGLVLYGAATYAGLEAVDFHSELMIISDEDETDAALVLGAEVPLRKTQRLRGLGALRLGGGETAYIPATALLLGVAYRPVGFQGCTSVALEIGLGDDDAMNVGIAFAGQFIY